MQKKAPAQAICQSLPTFPSWQIFDSSWQHQISLLTKSIFLLFKNNVLCWQIPAPLIIMTNICSKLTNISFMLTNICAICWQMDIVVLLLGSGFDYVVNVLWQWNMDSQTHTKDNQIQLDHHHHHRKWPWLWYKHNDGGYDNNNVVLNDFRFCRVGFLLVLLTSWVLVSTGCFKRFSNKN